MKKTSIRETNSTSHWIVLALLGLVIGLCRPATIARAQGGLALSGNFYRQSFRVPRGTAVMSPDIQVVVFNNSDSGFGVKMTTMAPEGVTVLLEESEFRIEAGQQRSLAVGIEVGEAVVPGEYEVMVVAEAQRESGGGIQLLGAAAQRAQLTVTGDVAQVTIRSVSPDGQPVPATVRFYRLGADQRFELAYSEDGVVDTKAAPGNYVAAALMGGEHLAEETFSLAPNESKAVELVVHTLHVEGFGVLPVHNTQTGELAFARVVYTVNNLAQPFARAEALLHATREGQDLEETIIATMAPLERGRMGSNYNYMPAEGWKVGTYTFRVTIEVDGQTLTASAPAEFVVTRDDVRSSGLDTNVILIALGALLIVGLVMVIIVLLRKRNTPTGAQ